MKQVFMYNCMRHMYIFLCKEYDLNWDQITLCDNINYVKMLGYKSTFIHHFESELSGWGVGLLKKWWFLVNISKMNIFFIMVGYYIILIWSKKAKNTIIKQLLFRRTEIRFAMKGRKAKSVAVIFSNLFWFEGVLEHNGNNNMIRSVCLLSVFFHIFL